MSRSTVIAALLLGGVATAQADASLERGQSLFQTKCSICHSSEAGAEHSVGPNLHGVVGRDIGRAKGFAYSVALSEAKESWTPEHLDAFLTSPAQSRPGTAMPFSGLKKPEDRQSLILFLQSLTTQE